MALLLSFGLATINYLYYRFHAIPLCKWFEDWVCHTYNSMCIMRERSAVNLPLMQKNEKYIYLIRVTNTEEIETEKGIDREVHYLNS